MQQLRLILGRMLHHDHHLLDPGDEVHGAAHALDHLARDHPIGEVAVLSDLHRAEHREVDVSAAHHAEAVGTREIAGGRQLRDGLLPGIDKIGVFLAFKRKGAGAEVNIEAVPQLLGGAFRHLLSGPGHVVLSRVLAHGALLDVLDGVWNMDDAFDENAGRYDVIGIDLAWLNEMLDFRHRHSCRGRHRGIEIPRRLPIDEVTLAIALEGMDDGEISHKPGLHDVSLAMEYPHFLAARNVGSGASTREEGRDAGAAGADSLRQGALRIELDLEFARKVLLSKQLVLPHVGRDHLSDLLGFEKYSEPNTVDPGIVGHHGEVSDARVADCPDQCFRDAAQPETTSHDQHTVFEHPRERRWRIGVDLVHELASPDEPAVE